MPAGARFAHSAQGIWAHGGPAEAGVKILDDFAALTACGGRLTADPYSRVGASLERKEGAPPVKAPL